MTEAGAAKEATLSVAISKHVSRVPSGHLERVVLSSAQNLISDKYKGKVLKFSFTWLKVGSPYCITKVTNEFATHLINELAKLQRQTVESVFHPLTSDSPFPKSKGKNGKRGRGYLIPTVINCHRFNESVREILADLSKQDGRGEQWLHVLDISQKGRVFGILSGSTFDIYWIDQQHKVYNSDACLSDSNCSPSCSVPKNSRKRSRL